MTGWTPESRYPRRNASRHLNRSATRGVILHALAASLVFWAVGSSASAQDQPPGWDDAPPDYDYASPAAVESQALDPVLPDLAAPVESPPSAPRPAPGAAAAREAAPNETDPLASLPGAATGTATTTTLASPAPVEPPVSPAEAVAILRDACFKPLGDLEASAAALEAAGFTRDKNDGSVTIYARDGMAAFLAKEAIGAATDRRMTSQCTLIVPGLAASDLDTAMAELIVMEGFVERGLRRSDGAVIRDFGSRGGGVSAPALGSTVTLDGKLASAILQQPAGGVGVLRHPTF